MSTKGEAILSHVYDKFSMPMVYLLEKLGAKIVKFNDFYVMSYSPTKKSEITKIIDDFKSKQIEAAITIQSSFRGFWARKTISEYKDKKNELTSAQDAFNAAETKFKML